MSELNEIGATELRRMIGAKQLSPTELLEASIERIELVDPAVNAIPIRDYVAARKAALMADDSVIRGETLGPLHGLPIGVKDLNHAKGLRTTFGSRIYKDNIAEDDELGVSYVRQAGAIIVGKTNTTEFGAGSNTTNDVFGATRNPFDLSLTSGGSSGGSAVALATGMLPLALGNDTGGSLRVPSAFCGTVAIRASLGAVPYERRPFMQTPFNVQGPMARNIVDLKLLFSVLARENTIDPLTSALVQVNRPVDLSRLRIAATPDLGFAPTSRMIRRVFSDKLKRISKFVSDVNEATPSIESAVDVNWVLRGLQFRALHRDRIEKNRGLMGALVVGNYDDALKLTVEEVVRALAEQARLYRVMEEFLSGYDVLICPVSTVQPFPVEELFPKAVDGEEQENYVRWAGLTNGLSVTGNPIVSLSCGVDETGMPFGIQLVARRGSDWSLLAIAEAFESAFVSDQDLRRPMPNIASLSTA
jgi:amidase